DEDRDERRAAQISQRSSPVRRGMAAAMLRLWHDPDVIDPGALRLEFAAELWYWRGPAPYHFVTVPPDDCATLAALAPTVSYGWGMIPVRVRIGDTDFDTSLWPKDGRYLVPIRDVVRNGEALALGDLVEVELRIRMSATRRPGREVEIEYDLD